STKRANQSLSCLSRFVARSAFAEQLTEPESSRSSSTSTSKRANIQCSLTAPQQKAPSIIRCQRNFQAVFIKRGLFAFSLFLRRVIFSSQRQISRRVNFLLPRHW